MQLTINVDSDELDRYVKTTLREDLSEYKNYILKEAIENDDQEEILRINKIIASYETILNDCYQYVPEVS